MNSEQRADLHTHSTCSDGSLSPVELVEAASSMGLAGLSITDHDTVESFEMASSRAQELGLALLPGVEFSTVVGDESVHLLAYSYRIGDEGLQTLCERHRRRRCERNREILRRLSEAGMPVTEEEVLAAVSRGERGVIGRPHIAQAMVTKGYIRSVAEAFHHWIGAGKPCFAAGDRITAEETIAAIHAADGFAVIAHPALIRSGETVAALLRMAVDGIEGYYSHLHWREEAPWIQLAKAHKLLITGGSDFHGECKPRIKLGSSWAPEESFHHLLKHHLDHMAS